MYIYIYIVSYYKYIIIYVSPFIGFILSAVSVSEFILVGFDIFIDICF